MREEHTEALLRRWVGEVEARGEQVAAMKAISASIGGTPTDDLCAAYLAFRMTYLAVIAATPGTPFGELAETAMTQLGSLEELWKRAEAALVADAKAKYKVWAAGEKLVD